MTPSQSNISACNDREDDDEEEEAETESEVARRRREYVKVRGVVWSGRESGSRR